MAPASRARSTSSRWLNAVSTMTGAIRDEAICSAADNPSSTGIWMSRITRSGASSIARSHGLLPVTDLGDDLVPLLLEHLLEIETDECFVLGDEDPDRLAAHGGEPSHGDPSRAPR